MNPSDLLAETVFGKRTSSKKHHPAGPHFGVENLAPKVGAFLRRNGFAAAVLESEIWTPKRGPTNVVFPTFLGVSACVFNALRRGQACWSKRSRVTFFDDAPSEATCAPPSQRAQGKAPVSATGFWTGFRTLFLGPTQRLFFPSRAYKLANVSHTLVSKIAVCERERVAHVCCAALAQCMPVHAHCGAHACSIPQKERKSQCTICQSCNLKLPRRCQSNTEFCALCRFGRQTWTWEGACAYGLFATLQLQQANK